MSNPAGCMTASMRCPVSEANAVGSAMVCKSLCLPMRESLAASASLSRGVSTDDCVAAVFSVSSVLLPEPSSVLPSVPPPPDCVDFVSDPSPLSCTTSWSMAFLSACWPVFINGMTMVMAIGGVCALRNPWDDLVRKLCRRIGLAFGSTVRSDPDDPSEEPVD